MEEQPEFRFHEFNFGSLVANNSNRKENSGNEIGVHPTKARRSSA
jgi:hypothetical protein